ncbi:hypothetical protein FXO37_35535 [Capsicum annuum]|nr:hypothetical protein FXO37_35535 [Capsicum annuum]
MCQTNNATKEFYCRNTSKVAVDGTNAEESGARSEGPGHRRNMKVNVADSKCPILKLTSFSIAGKSKELLQTTWFVIATDNYIFFLLL